MLPYRMSSAVLLPVAISALDREGLLALGSRIPGDGDDAVASRLLWVAAIESVHRQRVTAGKAVTRKEIRGAGGLSRLIYRLNGRRASPTLPEIPGETDPLVVTATRAYLSTLGDPDEILFHHGEDWQHDRTDALMDAILRRLLPAPKEDRELAEHKARVASQIAVNNRLWEGTYSLGKESDALLRQGLPWQEAFLAERAAKVELSRIPAEAFRLYWDLGMHRCEEHDVFTMLRGHEGSPIPAGRGELDALRVVIECHKAFGATRPDLATFPVQSDVVVDWSTYLSRLAVAGGIPGRTGGSEMKEMARAAYGGLVAFGALGLFGEIVSSGRYERGADPLRYGRVGATRLADGCTSLTDLFRFGASARERGWVDADARVRRSAAPSDPDAWREILPRDLAEFPNRMLAGEVADAYDGTDWSWDPLRGLG